MFDGSSILPVNMLFKVTLHGEVHLLTMEALWIRELRPMGVNDNEFEAKNLGPFSFKITDVFFQEF